MRKIGDKKRSQDTQVHQRNKFEDVFLELEGIYDTEQDERQRKDNGLNDIFKSERRASTQIYRKGINLAG